MKAVSQNSHRLPATGCRLAAAVLCLTLLLSGCRTNFPPLEESRPEDGSSFDSSFSDGTSNSWGGGVSGETTGNTAGNTTGTNEDNASEPTTSTDGSDTGTTSTATDGNTTTGSHTTADTTPSTSPAPAPGGYTPLKYGTMKACWLSQFDMLNIYKVNGRQRDQADFTARVEQIFDNLCTRAINTVIVQVRPYADSFYPSEYFPWSNYVTGSHNVEGTYDPLAIMVEAAHERGLSIHAWINPMRGMTSAQITDVGSQYPMRQWYNDTAKRGKYIVEWSDDANKRNKRWYLNPAYPEVRKLIADGAAEIVRNYDIDGIHMDDYFYPTPSAAFDESAYLQFGSGMTLTNFRYSNTNAMVREIYQAVKAVNSQVLFGVSPAGNVTNNLTVYYADVTEWCTSSGYMDYISPQVYWGMEHTTHDFVKISRQWDQMISPSSGVKLVIGMTLQKASTHPSSEPEWGKYTDVIKRCMESLSSLNHCSGVSLFSYQFLFDPLTGAVNSSTKAEVDNFLSVLQNMNFG